MDNKFDSTYSVVNAIHNEMGGVAQDFDSTYSICLAILDLVKQGGGGSSYTLPIASSTVLGGVQPLDKTTEMIQPVGVDAAGKLFTKAGGAKISDILFDATELFTKAQSGDTVDPTFITNLSEAIAANKILYICDKSNGQVSVVITFIDNTNPKFPNFTASDGATRYKLSLDVDAKKATASFDKIGDPFNRYENGAGNSIFDLTTDSTNEQIKTAFTNTKGEIVIPNTGDVFSIVDEAGVADSGIVMSKTSTPNSIDVIILSNNLVDVYSVQHHIKFNYSAAQGVDSLTVAEAVHVVIDPALIEHEKMTKLYADVTRKQDKLIGTAIEGQNIKTINGESILGAGDIVIEAGGGGVGKPGESEGSEIFNDYVNNIASGLYSHAEGTYSKAVGQCSHAEGGGTGSGSKFKYNLANGDYSHAEGHATLANGNYSHTEGEAVRADAKCSHAEGSNTAAVNFAQHVCGVYNTEETTPSPTSFNAEKTIFQIGNGTYETRSDAVKVLGNGTTWIAGIGDFNGTNPTPENSLQAVIANAGGGSSSVTVEDTLTSTSAANALSANQGKVLKDLIDAQAVEIQSLKDAIGVLTTQLDKINGETI